MNNVIFIVVIISFIIVCYGLSLKPHTSKSETKENLVSKDYNVGRANVLIIYLDINNKLTNVLVCLDGELYYDSNSNRSVRSAIIILNTWLSQAIKFGVYDVYDELLIPVNRVLQLKLTYEDLFITE